MELHQVDEGLVNDTCPQVFLGVAKPGHLVLRQVNAAELQVLLHVPGNIGQLHSQAQVHGVSLGAGVLVTENLQADQPNHRGDLVAVSPQLLEVLVTVLHQVALHAGDDTLEVLFRDIVPLGNIGQGQKQGSIGVSRVGCFKAGLNLAQRSDFGVVGPLGVHRIVTMAAESVCNVYGAAAFGRQSQESVVEVFRFPASYGPAFFVGKFQVVQRGPLL